MSDKNIVLRVAWVIRGG